MPEYNQTRSFNLGVAQETSVEAALIYDDLAYAQNIVGQGQWFYRSYEQLMRRLPYSEQTLRRHIKKLVDGGWILTKVRKLDGTPVSHYQIGRFLSAKLADSMETTKLADSYKDNNYKTTKNTDAVDFGASEPPQTAAAPPANSSARVDGLLGGLIKTINPREKITDERRRSLRARLKDYTYEEVIAAANAFSKSDWHKANGQMSIDNLLAPSKFGRWFTASQEQGTGGKSRADLEAEFEAEQVKIAERNRQMNADAESYPE